MKRITLCLISGVLIIGPMWLIAYCARDAQDFLELWWGFPSMMTATAAFLGGAMIIIREFNLDA